MIDLHCHLLHGIDDGPETLEQSLELCRLALADGITHAVVTPHIHPGRWENSNTSIAAACGELQRILEQQDISLQLGFAAEVRLTDQVMPQILADDIPFLGEVDGFRVLLLEFPHSHVIPGSEKLVEWLLDRGIRPLIAHPERNKQIMKDISLLQPFLDRGCWLQLTAGAVVGRFGEPARLAARELLHQDAVAVLASDGHNAGARPPALSEAFACLSREFGEEYAWRLVRDMPMTIVGSQFDGRISPVN